VVFEDFAGAAAVAAVRRWAATLRPACIAVDSPAAWAETGHAARACEVDFARARVCGIRFTPDAATAAARTDAYYGWIEHGLDLWRALVDGGERVIECFPTASFSQWVGGRSGRTRATWTRQAVQRFAVAGVTGTTAAGNQDRRDALAAALTARQYAIRPASTLSFGPLKIPRPGSDPLAHDGRRQERWPPPANPLGDAHP
jgi:predicted nuclease with RNAse H fold